VSDLTQPAASSGTLESSAAENALWQMGRVIRRRRRALDLSQGAAAARAGMGESHWSAIERGRKNARMMTFGRVARALGWELDELVCAAGPARRRHEEASPTRATNGEARVDLRAAVGIVIRTARGRQGLTQREWAERAGLSRTNVCRVERGEVNLTLHTLEALARAVRLTPAELLTRADRLCDPKPRLSA
jgi:XRE family transcriptional regulator, regulator of sulfur utilization